MLNLSQYEKIVSTLRQLKFIFLRGEEIMSELMEIQPMVQQVAEAISAALKIEVEITDDQLVRVAATGVFKNKIMEKMEKEGFVYRQVLDTGNSFIIENPGYHELCRPCPLYQRCDEKGEVCSPIKFEEQTVGVIGLLSFNEEQKKLMIDNKDSLLVFINKMAELISGKILEAKVMRQQSLVTSQLRTVMNFLNDGIIAVDSNAIISHVNNRAEKILGFKAENTVKRPINEVISSQEILQDILSMECYSARKFTLRRGCKNIQFLYSIIPIVNSGSFEGAVITLTEMEEVSRLIYEISDQQRSTSFNDIIGDSKLIRRVKNDAFKVAKSESTVLIRGESGTGKELFARAIHQNSKRAKGPFIALNCAAIPENLLESELFGYDEGAFTGAKKGGKLGKFDLASGGTIFLDEIGDMSLYLQAKLLRVLQEKKFERVGGIAEISVNVRIIAATNRKLEQMIAEGSFREDLYYRLNVIPLHIPALRDRNEDISIIAKHFLNYYNSLLNKNLHMISVEAMNLLKSYSWPGNIRELSNVIEYAVNMENNRVLSADSLPARLKENQNRNRNTDKEVLLTLNLKELEKAAILQALNATGSDIKAKDAAARMLGISRASLYRKLKEYQIEGKSHYETVLSK